MKVRTVLFLVVTVSSFALAQSTSSDNPISTVPELHSQSKPADAPKSMSNPSPEPFIESTLTRIPNKPTGEHSRFFDRRNLKLFGVNVMAQTGALLAIQSHGGGGVDWAQSRGRTLDPFEKHFESYGYGWGAVYCYGGGVGLNTLIAYMFHETGHHKLEHVVPYIAIAHAEASTGYAITGSKQGRNGW